ncbi:MAG TPA: PhzF family phenazine biosynthesis protein [Syntrophorhabdales bacterium]|nr:PhzF family phenazine biosynthesis protein [Syntrophorhabdales bacterium]
MDIKFYQIDAFADRVFAGNPAGVCFLDAWPEDRLLQSIASENNLSETAFLVRQGDLYELRWFTPKVEVDLCGHATLASAFAIFERERSEIRRVDFRTKSGLLSVERERDLLMMDFPARPPGPCNPPPGLARILGLPPVRTMRARDLLAVYEEEDEVRELTPDYRGIAALEYLGVIVTAPGKKSDFVSRFFAPRVGVPEDPVTGSAHCTLIPYWSGRLGKKQLHALQLSERGGELFCLDKGERVGIGGRAVTYLSGTLTV